MERIDALWQRIEAGWPKQAVGRDFPRGLPEGAIALVESILGVTFPEAVRASYRRHNGGYSVELVSTMDVLSLQAAVTWWNILRDLRQDPEWAGQQPYYFTEEALRSGWRTGPIQPVCWHPRWIPIASDLAGNLACLDFAPAPGGMIGQILHWDHERGPSRVLFPSFERLLAALAEQVESGDVG